MREALVKTEEFKDSRTEKMPARWQVKPLREIADLQVGFAFKSEWFQEHEGIRLLRGENVGYGSPDWSETRRLPWKMCPNYQEYELVAGDIIIGMDRTFTKSGFKISVLEPDDVPALLVQRVGRFIPINCDHQFLKVLLNSQEYHHALLAQQKGMDIPHLSKTEILEPVVAVPPVDEQRQIAEILNTIDEAIAHTSSLIAKLKQMKAGLLHDLLTRGLDENGELRDAIAHPEQFKDSPLGQIPKDWECGIAQLFCDGIVVGVVCNATDSYVDKGVPFLRSQNIRPNYIDTNGLLYISPTFNTLQSKSILHSGDVIIVRTGANTGMTAVVPESLEGANCFSLVVCRPNRAKLNSYFFSHYLNSESCQALMNRTHFGSAQHNFNIGEMNRLLIAVPPLEEQAEIVCRIEAYDNRIRTEESYRDKIKLQKQGLMHDLLTGKVRVKDA